ncbi:MAG: hypothetical protein WBG71_05245 [Leeuwenhoekiella sp.]
MISPFEHAMIFKRLKNLNYKVLPSIFVLLVKRPGYLIPTWRATVATLKIASATYPKTHNRDGRGNAFKHALWNISILFYLNKTEGRQLKNTLSWTKNVTDANEDLFDNPIMQRTMDIQNNKAGRDLFVQNPKVPFETLLNELKKKTEEAIPFKDPSKIDIFSDHLVYIKV